MAELSPKAQAVLDAFTEDNSLHDRKHNYYNLEALAAALRAAVEQAIPLTKTPWGTTLIPVLTAQESRERLFAIADELENHQ